MTTDGIGKIANRMRSGLLVAVSSLALSACVSATGDVQPDDGGVAAEAAASQVETPEAGGGGQTARYRDPMVSAGGNDAGQSGPPEAGGAPSEPASFAETIMQPAQVNASQTSIFASAAAPGEQGPVADPGAEPTGRSITNLYQSDSATMPADDTTGAIPAASGVSPAPMPAPDEEAALVPDRVPVPTSVRTALVAEGEGNDAARALAAGPADGAPAAETEDMAVADPGPQENPAGSPETRLTLAALFAAKRKPTGNTDAEKPSTVRKTRLLNRETAVAYQAASLDPSALPDVAAAQTAAPGDHSEAEESPDDADDNGGVTEVASLAGLARLSPNGLWLQTEKVNTGCFKPELLTVLKTVEQHYGKPVIVTSGVRPIKRNRAKQSLHTRCEAADIQIAGVSRWELAQYLRSMPGRGGVGTYCHTESVHIDIGPERDWNWRCRGRRK